jgi:hypothetical protein
MRVVIIAMTALLCVGCAQQDRQAAPVSSDVSSASAVPSSAGESEEAVPAQSSAPASGPASLNPSSEASAEDSSASPVADEEKGLKAGEAAAPPLASVSAFVGSLDLNGEATMRGQFLKISEHPAVYELIGCSFDCRTGAFALPVADGPLTRIATGPGTAQWSFTYDSYYPNGKPTHVYPGQVYFTAVQQGEYIDSLKRLGFTEIPLGEMVGSGIRSLKVPASWPTPASPYVGELRLFPVGAKLPVAFIPADGRIIAKETQLGAVLASARFPEVNGGFVVPKMAPVDGYQWVIAARGVFPAG